MSMAILSLLYRGPLASCNYRCAYCPFAKRRDSRASLAHDRAQLERFVAWIAERGDDIAAAGERINLLFTPWGEALTRRHYREAMVRLSHLPQVARVAIQTNLSIDPRWLTDAQADKVSLWCTYHPGETPRRGFLQRIAELRRRGVRHSVGVVALATHWAEIGALRLALPPASYLWINAYQGPSGETDPAAYSDAEAAWLTAIDPWFPGNRRPPPSLGAPCRAGDNAFFVADEGRLQPCHFRPEPRGSLYQANWREAMIPGACPKPRCDCYIGYTLRSDLPQGTEFGLGDLGRSPPDYYWKRPAGWRPEGPTPVEGAEER